MKNWLIIALGSAISLIFLWCLQVPLGIPGEWTWKRSEVEADTLWNLVGGMIAAGVFIGFVLFIRWRFEEPSTSTWQSIEIRFSLAGLVALSFAWIWIVQEIAPLQSRIGKAAFVLYYPSSSGYFTRARYEEPNPSAMLANYENLMGQGDVLHTGTHPPGLFLVFHGLISLCDSSPWLSSVLDATQPLSFRESCDVIATNSLRTREPRPLQPLDRRVLWLATVLSMFFASLTIVPLFLLIRRDNSLSNAWTCAALWPAIPAVAVFIPKSDTVFPFIGILILWIWITAWDRRSLVWGLLSGLLTWCGLMCSLAFLPVVLAAGILTLGSSLLRQFVGASSISNTPASTEIGVPVGVRRMLCIAAAGLGFAAPTAALWHFTNVNMLNVWLMNYRNHAAFYHQYARTYWKWLLLNPVELCFAAGFPLVFLALSACKRFVTTAFRRNESLADSRPLTIVVSLSFVWGLLWLTGKNSGEAARLWIVFLPWLVWLASTELFSNANDETNADVRQRQALEILVLQFTVCLLTVTRVNGFYVDAG